MAECLGNIVSKICSDTAQRVAAFIDLDKNAGTESTCDEHACQSRGTDDSPSSGSKSGSFENVATPVAPLRTDPIVLETMQGNWFNSMGAKINVNGTTVTLNGHVLAMHPLRLNDDGTIQSIGSIWQLWGWAPGDKVEFKEAPSRESATYARSVFWNKMDGEGAEKQWKTHMTNLGYAGSALGDLTKRGIEGCRPGSCDAYRPAELPTDTSEEEVHHLAEAISKWRLKGLHPIKPASAIPDYTNRSHTGISVEHMHYLAKSFVERGFQKRDNESHKGHDMPVVVLERPDTELGKKSIDNWRSRVAEDEGFPPMSHYEKTFRAPTLYTTLGNGHFFQALNLVSNACPTINSASNPQYSIGNDPLLSEAIHSGVGSIVLKTETPMEVRLLISRLLNSKREFRWKMSKRGSFCGLEEDTTQVSQFVAMSKVLDAVELNCLVRAELGVSDSHRIGK